MDDETQAVLSGYFDPEYYAERHAGALGGAAPFQHYLDTGLAENLRPSIAFDPVFYLARYRDVRRRGIPAMQHFLHAGLSENRLANTTAELRQDKLLDAVSLKRLFVKKGGAATPSGEILEECIERALDAGDAADAARGWENRFDNEYYLAEHPDVARSDRQPLLHYLKHGQFEGRRTSVDVLDELVEGRMATRPGARTCLLFINEMSRTGAPVVALEIARELSRGFNVVCISRSGGVLEEAFAAVCTETMLKCRTLADAHVLVRAAVRRADVAFAILNSVEATAPLPALLANGVPSVSLVHEYAQYTLPHEKIHKAVLLSDHIVFSSRHVMETWQKEMRAVYGSGFGNCSVMHQPAALDAIEKVSGSRQALRERLSAKHGLDLADTLLVMGGGTVQLRKGFELFLQTAKTVRGLQADDPLAGRRRIFFLWIGKGLDSQDRTYGLWLREEVARMPADLFAWFEPDPDFHDFVAASDIFFSSSRLDPFPNVAIDALLLGSLPMFFDDATGFQELVEARGLPHIKARYLDTYDAARRILQHDPLAKHGDAAAARAATDFAVEPYVVEILRLAQAAAERARRSGAEEAPERSDPAALPFGDIYLGREREPGVQRDFRRKLRHSGMAARHPADA